MKAMRGDLGEDEKMEDVFKQCFADTKDKC